MPSTFLADVILVLEGAGLGTYGTDIFKGSKSAPPNGGGPYITVIPYTGRGEEGTHNLSPTTIAYEQPSAQIVCRARNFDDAYDRAQLAYEALSFVNQFVNGTWWRLSSPKGELMDQGLDEQERARVAFNLDCVKRLSSATS